MKRCYRTPGSTLVVAHAIGMGLLRTAGMLSGFTDKEDWGNIGYTVDGKFKAGNQIMLHRPTENSPNPIPELWGRVPLDFEVYEDHEQQLQALIEKIQYNLSHDDLNPSRDILVIVLSPDQDAQSSEQFSKQQFSTGWQLQRLVANNLQKNGISYYMPGAVKANRYVDSDSRNPDRFWWQEAVTVSRIYRAKGHEAPMVYVLGLELIAQDESNLALRNQLFVALTRSMAWTHLSGIRDPNTHSEYLFYQEIRNVLNQGNTLKFTYRKSPKRVLSDDE